MSSPKRTYRMVSRLVLGRISLTDGILAKRRAKRGLRGRGKTGRERGWAIFCGAWLTTVVAGVLGTSTSCQISHQKVEDGKTHSPMINEPASGQGSGTRHMIYLKHSKNPLRNSVYCTQRHHWEIWKMEIAGVSTLIFSWKTWNEKNDS